MPRKPTGKAIEYSDEDLERISQVTPDDVTETKAFVDSKAPELGRVLDAKLVEDANTN